MAKTRKPDAFGEQVERIAMDLLLSAQASLAGGAPNLATVLEGRRIAAGFEESTPEEMLARTREAIVHVVEVQEAMMASSPYYTDPDEAFDGWLPLLLGIRGLYLENETFLTAIRNTGRLVATSNEIGKAIIRIRKNYLVGAGLQFEVSKIDAGADPEAVADAGEDATATLLSNNWTKCCESNKLTMRLLEMVERDTRDGEWFLRLFKGGRKWGGVPQMRFVDPQLISGVASKASQMAGRGLNLSPTVGVIVGDDGTDEETQVGFIYVDIGGLTEPTTVPADRMVHSQRNVDANMRRGVSDFYPVFSNIRRAEKLLVNVSVMAQIQSAIAMVRKHTQASLPKVQSFQARQSDGKPRTDAVTGKSQLAQKLPRGSIVDAAGFDYEFPAHSVLSANFLTIVVQELQHIGGCFQVPWEWLVGQEPVTPVGPGSPSTKNFQTEQGILFDKVRELFWKVQAMFGVPDIATLKATYQLTIHGPNLAMGTGKDEAQIDEIYQRTGAMSPQTMAARRGLNYQKERSNTIKHRKTRQPDEVMPGDAGSGTPNGEKGGGGDGESKKNGGTRGGAKDSGKK